LPSSFAAPIILLVSLLLREYPPGVDSYYFLLNAKAGIISPAMPPAFQYLAVWSSGWGWVAIPPLAALASVILLALIGRKMKLRNWELAGAALLLAPIFFYRFAIFEDDLLAYPLLLLAVYLFLEKKWWGFAASFAMAFFWKGWFIVTLLLAFLTLPEIPAAVLLLGIAAGVVYISLNSGVAELIPLSVGVIFLLYPYFEPLADLIRQNIPMYDYYKTTLLRWAVFSFGLAMAATRFLIFAVFPLALTYAHYSGWEQKGKIVRVMTIAMLFSSLIIVYAATPSTELMECIKEHPNATVDWSLGYYKEWFGGEAAYTPLRPSEQPRDYRADIRYEFWKEDCQNL